MSATPRPGRPALGADTRTMPVKVPASLLSLAREAAARQGLSVSEWVRAAMLAALAKGDAR